MLLLGSCQFPTLGFVVERFKDRENFVSEPFWKIIVRHTHETDAIGDEPATRSKVEFDWARVRLFDYDVCLAIYEHVIADPLAKVIEVKRKPKSKWRPVALDTVVSYVCCHLPLLVIVLVKLFA